MVEIYFMHVFPRSVTGPPLKKMVGSDDLPFANKAVFFSNWRVVELPTGSTPQKSNIDTKTWPYLKSRNHQNSKARSLLGYYPALTFRGVYRYIVFWFHQDLMTSETSTPTGSCFHRQPVTRGSALMWRRRTEPWCIAAWLVAEKNHQEVKEGFHFWCGRVGPQNCLKKSGLGGPIWLGWIQPNFWFLQFVNVNYPLRGLSKFQLSHYACPTTCNS